VAYSNYDRLLVLLCMAAFSGGVVLGSGMAVGVHSAVRKRLARKPARERAALLFALGIAPTVSGLMAAVGIALAFLRHEPAHTSEQAGTALTMLAAGMLVLMALAALQIVKGALRTRRCHQLLARCGQKIDIPGFPLPAWRIVAPFPVAAVSGVLSPRLILSSRLLEECTADELAIVVRHETAHARHRDNLLRGCLLALPDPFGFLKRGDIVAKEWQQAVEEAADDEAVRAEAAARVTLAGALVRVGRITAGPPPSWMPRFALYDGDNLEKRVRRLLAPAAAVAPRATRERVAILAIGALMSAIAVWAASGPRPLHTLMEWAVRHLP
jgi:beta-lactamase regulating signal transducer with metallopeptidase domain